MNISYNYDNINWIIFIVGVVVILHMLSLKRMKDRTIKFANYEVLEKALGKKIMKKNYIPLIIRVLTILVLTLALSNLTITIVKPVSDIDFVIAIDTSQTMLASDNGNFTPNRLESAKLSAYKLVRETPTDTDIGLVTFAGKSYVKSHLTKDKRNLRNILRNIKSEKPAGTAIGDAIVSSSLLLANSTDKKVVLLITDGSSNRGVSINESLKYAKEYGVSIYTIGVGLKNDTYRSMLEKFNLSQYINGVKENNESFYVLPVLDEYSLKYIANRTNGEYIYVKNDTEMENAFRDIMIKSRVVKINVMKWSIIVAIVLLIIEWSLGITKYKTIP